MKHKYHVQVQLVDVRQFEVEADELVPRNAVYQAAKKKAWEEYPECDYIEVLTSELVVTYDEEDE